MQTLGIIMAIALGFLLVINGAIMLASPRAWFQAAGMASFSRNLNAREIF